MILGYDLPPVSTGPKTGAMMANDYDILKAASSNLFQKPKKDPSYDAYNDDANFDPWNKPKEEEGKSLRELMREKINNANTPPKEEVKDGKETVEQRKARLKAQRDLLVQKK